MSIHRNFAQLRLLNPVIFAPKFFKIITIFHFWILPYEEKTLFPSNSNLFCTFPIKINAWFIYPFASNFFLGKTGRVTLGAIRRHFCSQKRLPVLFVAYGYDLFAPYNLFTLHSVLSLSLCLSLRILWCHSVALSFTALRAYHRSMYMRDKKTYKWTIKQSWKCVHCCTKVVFQPKWCSPPKKEDIWASLSGKKRSLCFPDFFSSRVWTRKHFAAFIERYVTT